jgi:hypothetical protein
MGENLLFLSSDPISVWELIKRSGMNKRVVMEGLVWGTRAGLIAEAYQRAPTVSSFSTRKVYSLKVTSPDKTENMGSQ